MKTDDHLSPLISLKDARLSFPTLDSSYPLQGHLTNLEIHHATSGGHLLIGPNGSGKSLAALALAHSGSERVTSFLGGGRITTQDGWTDNSVALVSFQSHQTLLEQGGTVYSALQGPPLDDTAKYFVVRFGLAPLLWRSLGALSTGEIRKVLLARALSKKPRLLILDNAFDGLDANSRSDFGRLVSETLAGFKQLLVQGVSSRSTVRTQVLLVSHRPEEVVEEITSISYPSAALGGVLVTCAREGRPAADLFEEAMGAASGDASSGLPSTQEVQAVWSRPPVRPKHPPPLHATNSTTPATATGALLVSARGLRVTAPELDARGRVSGRASLLAGLNWAVAPGEHWWVAGGNGAGKSTLSRLLARAEVRHEPRAGVGPGPCHGPRAGGGGPLWEGSLKVLGSEAAPSCRGSEDSGEGCAKGRPGGSWGRLCASVGWVSTELHLARASDEQAAALVLSGGGAADTAVCQAVARWLGLGSMPSSASVPPLCSGNAMELPLLERPFCSLSQGEQKMVLIGAAIALRPGLLVMDEPTQGLDAASRHRVANVLERVSSVKKGPGLVYITHHADEVPQAVTHVLHLARGEVAFSGRRGDYDAEKAAAAAAAATAKKPTMATRSRDKTGPQAAIQK